MWRKGWDTPPPPMDVRTMEEWRTAGHCRTVTKLRKKGTTCTTILTEGLMKSDGASKPKLHREFNDDDSMILKETIVEPTMPASESLKDTCGRVLPMIRYGFAPRLIKGETILVSAHANTIRSILYWLDPGVTSETMKSVKIPSAQPLICRFREAGVGESSRPALSVVNVGEIDKGSNVRGEWVNTHEIQQLSFCTEVGITAGESEIA